jgi:hypothetical protein
MDRVQYCVLEPCSCFQLFHDNTFGRRPLRCGTATHLMWLRLNVNTVGRDDVAIYVRYAINSDQGAIRANRPDEGSAETTLFGAIGMSV